MVAGVCAWGITSHTYRRCVFAKCCVGREGGYCANDALISAIKLNACTLHQSDSRNNRILLQNVGPCRPEPAEQNPKHPILDPRPRARICSFEHAQLRAQCESLKTKVIAGTVEGAETGEESNEKSNHELGFIAQEPLPAPA